MQPLQRTNVWTEGSADLKEPAKSPKELGSVFKASSRIEVISCQSGLPSAISNSGIDGDDSLGAVAASVLQNPQGMILSSLASHKEKY